MKRRDRLNERRKAGIAESKKSNDVKKDQDTYLNSDYTKHNLIYVSTNKLSATVDVGISNSIVIDSLDKITITGVFEVDASGKYRINAGEVDFS